MNKKLLCGLLAVAMTFGLLCGCGSAPSDGGFQPSPLPDNAVQKLLKTTGRDDPDYFRRLAALAVEDVLQHFWTGDAETGHFVRTWNGFANDPSRDPRGSGWETGQLLFAVYDLWRATGDDGYLPYIKAEAAFYRENFTQKELTNAGGEFNWATDDCAWNAMQFLAFYTVTQDEWFLQCAIELLDNTRARWYDAGLGGMYYRDDADYMSLYETGCAISWYRIWELTGEQRFYDLALESYEGMHRRLLRDDGLYYCEANVYWPLGEKNTIMEARSSSFLTGNMGMAALAAKFYRQTGDETYLERVKATNEGLLEFYDNDGVLVNDRDAWTNGAFAAYYAADVLSLPETETQQALVRGTAESIMNRARTTNGYYGGSWSGPAEGGKSVWYAGGSVPQQSMTTATSVLMVVSAAVLEAQLEEYAR